MASQGGGSSSPESRLTGRGLGSINASSIYSRVESYEAGQKKCISDVRRTFCLFVTFDLLFITMLWIIELNVRCVCVIVVDYFPVFFVTCCANTLLLVTNPEQILSDKNLSSQSLTDMFPTSADPVGFCLCHSFGTFFR